LVGSLNAGAYEILDNYIGADPTSDSYDGKDRIGNAEWFEISKMDIDFTDDGIVVDIYTTYLDNIGKFGTELGDLFISTNGWSPYGSAPYVDDNAVNGEVWEYALVMDDHTPDTLSGDANLYAITDSAQIKLSYAPPGYIYRAGQEVQLIADEQRLPIDPDEVNGSWEIMNYGGVTDTDDFLRFMFEYDFASVDFGFHYTMTCGNDVIEGSVSPVSEPATLLLLGTGFIGLAVVGRKRFL
jgi:hypothetical protein